MNIKKTSNSLTILLAPIYFFVTFFSHANSIEVVVHDSLKFSEISKQQMKSIYLGLQTHWSNGKLIKLYKLPSKHKIHHSFVKNILGIYPYQYNRRWQKLVFSGFAVKPYEVSTEQELLKAVANTPNAIGYIENKITTEGIRYAALFDET